MSPVSLCVECNVSRKITYTFCVQYYTRRGFADSGLAQQIVKVVLNVLKKRIARALKGFETFGPIFAFRKLPFSIIDIEIPAAHKFFE